MNPTDLHRAIHPAVRLVARVRGAPEPEFIDSLDPKWDIRPGPDGVTDTIVIAATPRTGSNLITLSLRAAGFGVGDEYWAPRMLWSGYVRWGVPRSSPRDHVGQARRAVRGAERWWAHHRVRRHDLVRYQRLLEEHRTGPNGVFVIKLFPPEVQRLQRYHGMVPGDLLRGDLRWVHLRRRDKVAQAVSQFRAGATGQWVVTDERPIAGLDPDAVSDEDLATIRYWIDRFIGAEAWWAEHFERHGIEPIRIEYEQVSDALVDTLQALVEPVGGTIDADLLPPTRVQRDDASDELCRRFLTAHPEYAP